MALIVGIDPGKDVGFATAKDGLLLNVTTIDFWECINHLRNMQFMGITVYIEDPNVNRPIFIKSLFGTEKSKNLMMQKIAQDVGANKRDAQLIIEFCVRHKISVVPRPPLRGFFSKMNSKDFKITTGYTERTSQHGRDAAMLIYGIKA